MPESMTAIVQREYGGAEVLHVDEIERPRIAADEVLVRVEAAAIDRGTWHLMTGLPYLTRLMFGLRRPRNPVPGLDLAGTVVAVGDEVTRIRPGDRVFGIGQGSLAEYAAAAEGKLALAPDSIGADAAAALAVSGLTALQGLRDAGRLTEGQSVLVVGASGGVGSHAVQLAKALGAEVTGVASTAKLDLVRALGADHVIDYTTDDFADGTHRYDLVVDIGGNSRLRRLRRALAPEGTLVIVGGEDGGRWLGGIDRQLRALLWSPFLRQRLTTLVSKETHVDMEALAAHVDAGELRPAVERTYPLEQAPAAMRRLETGEVRGKLVIRIEPLDR